MLSNIREKREWFVSTETGREPSFNKFKKGSTDVLRFFKNGSIPDMQVFWKLFLSTMFSADSDDRAKPTGQNTEVDEAGVPKVIGGHVTIATDEEAIAKDNGQESLYTRAVRPSHLSETSASNTDTDLNVGDLSFQGVVIEVVRDVTETLRSKYLVKINSVFTDFLQQVFDVLSSRDCPIGTVQDYYGTSSTLSGRWLICDGKTLGNSTSQANYAGSQYRDLYLHCAVVQNIPEANAIDNFNNGVTINLPDAQGVFIRGAGSNQINGTTYTGVFGEYSEDSIKSHSHGVGTEFAFKASPTGTAFELNGSSPGQTTDPRVDFLQTAQQQTESTGTSETKPVSLTLTKIISY